MVAKGEISHLLTISIFQKCSPADTSKSSSCNKGLYNKYAADNFENMKSKTYKISINKDLITEIRGKLCGKRKGSICGKVSTNTFPQSGQCFDSS